MPYKAPDGLVERVAHTAFSMTSNFRKEKYMACEDVKDIVTHLQRFAHLL